MRFGTKFSAGLLSVMLLVMMLGIAPLSGVAFADHCPSGENLGYDAIVFTGRTTQLDPVLWVGGSGTFTFSGNSLVWASDGDVGTNPIQVCHLPEVGAPLGAQGTLAATGSYSNIVCGTGTATGSGSWTEPAIPPSALDPIGEPSSTESFTFTLAFIAGVGVLVGTPTAGTGAVAGAVQIHPTTGFGPDVPNPGAVGLGSCVRSFDVAGAAVAGGVE